MKKKMTGNCQIPTPKEYVKAMLDLLDCNDITYGKRILENSCGEGNVLCEVVGRFICSSRAAGISDEIIKASLENDIVGYEIDINKVETCIERLSETAKRYDITDVNWQIINNDYLESENGKYDIIVGNPPYITFHDMTQEQRKQLANNFVTCKEGRYDYCYAFIEKSIDSLNSNGKLIYLVPYSIIRNKFAGELRNKMKSVITAIYDYDGVKIFDDIISSSIIIVCNNNDSNTNVEYNQVLKKEKWYISRNDLNREKWFFVQRKKGKRFGDFFDIFNGVATLKNEVFIIKDKSVDVEEGFCFPAVSAKSLRLNEELRIVVPYDIGEGKFKKIDELTLKKRYPKGYAYLLKNKELLKERANSLRNEWYEYGRTQALSHVIGEKLVLSMIVTNRVRVYFCANNDVPFAGYFIKQKGNSVMGLEEARVILESEDFYEYVKTHGTPTTPCSYRISVNEIKEYRFS